jgi:hypothetical protein
MATLEELEARLTAIETGGMFASQTEFEQEQRKITAIESALNNIAPGNVSWDNITDKPYYLERISYYTLVDVFVGAGLIPTFDISYQYKDGDICHVYVDGDYRLAHIYVSDTKTEIKDDDGNVYLIQYPDYWGALIYSGDFEGDHHVTIKVPMNWTEGAANDVPFIKDKIGELPYGQTVVGYIDSKGVGADGKDGADGITPHIQDGYWWIGDTNTGVKAQGAQGIPGEKGDPYVLTDTDKAEIVEDVLTEMPESGGSIDPDAIAKVIADLITVGNKTLANALAEWAKTIPSYQLKYSARELEQKLSKI